ncbi:hypothetical protein [Endothiovibrio diazotrophicus]
MKLNRTLASLTAGMIVGTVALAEPPQAPVLSAVVNGVSAVVEWNQVAGSDGYRLFYAPIPFRGTESIGSIDVGSMTLFNVGLWPGAAFYVAAGAYNADGVSGYSNIETVVVADSASYTPSGDYTSSGSYTDSGDYTGSGSYTDTGGYTGSGSYTDSGGYTASGSYTDTGGYTASGSYTDTGGYTASGSYTDTGGYTTGGSYTDTGGYTASGSYTPSGS